MADKLENNIGGHGENLRHFKTATSINIPTELFEKLYLSPENNVKGDLRKTFGNPTPLFFLSTSTMPS